jgi:prepilin-type N-terminal cleavage/methylation domain-containing protein
LTSFCRSDEIRQAGGGHGGCAGRHPVGPAGFTLIELLLALSLFVMIAGVVFAAFSGITKGVEKGRQILDVYRLGRTALLHMAQEVGAAMHDDAYAGFAHGENDGQGGQARDRLTFVTAPYRPDTAPGSGLCEVAYYIGANSQGGAALYREQDCTPDGEPLNGETLELTDTAVGLDVTYFDREDSYDKWPGEGGRLPCLVRLVLTLRDEQARERAFITTVSLPMSKECRDVPSGG